MLRMANRAYASVWTKGFSEATMLDQFEAFLGTVPFSKDHPGLTGLVVRPVDPGESPLVERDFRLQPLPPAAVIEVAREHLNEDTAFEASAYWDIWACEAEAGRWEQRPQKLLITCIGEGYDEGTYETLGHFHVDLGFEHLFTGHAGLLGFNGHKAAAPEHPAEAAFLARMSNPANLREYGEKTRENIRLLLDWMRRVSNALPVERNLLWSEGEQNFEARLDEIVAGR
jgi:hypothetical protein